MYMYLLVFTGILGLTAVAICLIGVFLVGGAGWLRAQRQSTPSHSPASRQAAHGRRWFASARDEFASHRLTLARPRQRQRPW
jgi:hypothetical protein